MKSTHNKLKFPYYNNRSKSAHSRPPPFAVRNQQASIGINQAKATFKRPVSKRLVDEEIILGELTEMNSSLFDRIILESIKKRQKTLKIGQKNQIEKKNFLPSKSKGKEILEIEKISLSIDTDTSLDKKQDGELNLGNQNLSSSNKGLNYEKQEQGPLEPSYFDKKLTEQQFLECIVLKLLELGHEKITYQNLKKYSLPQHRKPNFNDYLRFRKVETCFTAQYG